MRLSLPARSVCWVKMALTAFASTHPLVAMYGDGQRRWRRRGGDVLGDLRRHGGDGGDVYLAVSVHLLFFLFFSALCTD